MKERLLNEFKIRYGRNAEHVFFCPGRINLIGEHIDYNGGKVMPCAITMGTFLAISKNTTKKIGLQSLDYPEKVSLNLQSSYSKTGSEWFNYPLGVIAHFTGNEMFISGLDTLYTGNLPIGAGLSSSASIEVLTASALNEMFGFDLPKKELALLCKKVENEFIGVSCGIMDQFAVVMGKKDNAILLNCDTLDFEYLPVNLGDHLLVIINTNKPRSLVGSKYNERFVECGMALKALKKEMDINNLCDVDMHSFSENRHLINDPVLEKRALHVISENFRVGEAATAIKEEDIPTFGKLMFASHQSLKDFYEVSGKELDTIVDLSKRSEGCLGARMTGAGFGGCAIAIVHKNNLRSYSEEISYGYEKAIGYKPGIFVSEIGEGAKEL